jgi:uncharacterized protein YoxC
MSLTGVAALIAAASFAVIACAVVYLALRFTKVLGDAATLVRETRADQQALFARANAAVDRASAQLDSTQAAAAAVADLGDSMTELAGQASALAGIGRSVAGAVVGGPVGRAAAVAYGVRHAVGLRRGNVARPGALRGQVVNAAGLPEAARSAAGSPAGSRAGSPAGSAGREARSRR